MKTKKTFALITFMMVVVLAQAQTPSSNPNLGTWAQNFYRDTVAPLFPWVLVTVFVVTALYNIGDLQGDQKNYKGFFTKIGLFIGGTAAVMGIAAWLTGLSL
jgi:formate hydrogenlyase subunit 3/multisubunit Na+/H+ antiporter MnhD subunit